MTQCYPAYTESLHFPEEENSFEMVMQAIQAVRARRSEMKVPPSRRPHLIICTPAQEAFRSGIRYIQKLAYAETVTVQENAPECLDGMVTVATDQASLYMPLAELVDLEKERARIRAELEKSEKLLEAQDRKLANQNFVTRAPESVVNIEREKKAKLESLIENLKKNLAELS